MAATKRKTKIKVKQFVFGVDETPSAALKIGVGLESVGTPSSQLAGLILSLIKFELLRRDAYQRWHLYISQVGLRLKDLIVYLDVLHDDADLVGELKAYYYKSIAEHTDKSALLYESLELREKLIDKIKQLKVLNAFPIHTVRSMEQITQ